MNPSCFTLIVAAVFLQICTSTAQEDFSQFEQQFKQLSEALGGGGAAVDAGAAADVGNASVAAGGVQNDAPPAAAPEQPSPEPTRVPKPEEASTFPPLTRQDAKGNSTEKPKDAATTPKSSTPKGDGGAGFAAANCALVLGVAGVLRLLY